MWQLGVVVHSSRVEAREHEAAKPVGTRRWAARHGVGGSARSRRGAGMLRMPERERAWVRTAGGAGLLRVRVRASAAGALAWRVAAARRQL